MKQGAKPLPLANHTNERFRFSEYRVSILLRNRIQKLLYSLLIGCIFLTTIPGCASESKRPSEKVSTARVYGDPLQEDKKEIESLFKLMVDAILDRDMQRLLPYIDDKDGLWIDLKAEWTKKEFEKDIRNPNGYVSTYFLNTETLRKKKNSLTALSVRDILLKSGGFRLEYYFESKDECEVNILFKNSGKYEYDLMNPVFRKNKNKWYIYRLL